MIVACDGCADATAERARAAGADLVLELPRGGKIRAQDAAVERARGELVAFSDANALWEPDAPRALVARVRGPARRLRLRAGRASCRPPTGAAAATRRALYWRYEMALRALESRLASITAGNGAIYATRRDSYIVVDPIMGHDLSLPFNMVKRGWRAVYVPGGAREREDGPVDRGRVRAQAADDEPHLADRAARRDALAARLPAGLRADDLLPPRCCATRRRSCTCSRSARTSRSSRSRRRARTLYAVTLALQLALLAARGARRRAARCARCSSRATTCSPTASPAAGLWDWLRHGTDAAWEAAEGTR